MSGVQPEVKRSDQARTTTPRPVRFAERLLDSVQHLLNIAAHQSQTYTYSGLRQ
jgi:hypothetical protein